MPLRSSILSLIWPMVILWMSSLRKVMWSMVSLCKVRALTILIFEVTIGNRLHCPISLAAFTFSKKDERETIFKGKKEMFWMQESSLESLSSSWWNGLGKSSMWNIDPCPITLFVISRLFTRSNLPGRKVKIVFNGSKKDKDFNREGVKRVMKPGREVSLAECSQDLGGGDHQL